MLLFYIFLKLQKNMMFYLDAKEKSQTHKLNWDYLLEKIKKETNLNKRNINCGEWCMKCIKKWKLP